MLAFPPDFTFVIQVASFFLLAYLLNKLLFEPFQELLAERDQRTTGDASEAAGDQAEAEALRVRIEGEMAEARARTMSEVEVIRRETRQEEARLFEEVKGRAAEKLEGLRADIDRERAAAAASLQEEAKGLAASMTGAVLGPDGDAR